MSAEFTEILYFFLCVLYCENYIRKKHRLQEYQTQEMKDNNKVSDKNKNQAIPEKPVTWSKSESMVSPYLSLTLKENYMW